MEYLLSGLLAITSTAAGAIFFDSFWKRSISGGRFWIVVLAISLLNFAGVNLLRIRPGAGQLLFGFLTFLCVALLYKGALAIHIMVALLWYALAYSLDFLVAGIFAFALNISLAALRASRGYCMACTITSTAVIPLLALLVRLIIPHINGRASRMRQPHFLLLGLYPLSTLLMLVIVSSFSTNQQQWRGFVVVGIVIMLLANFGLLAWIEKSEQRKDEILSLNRQLRLEGESIEALSEAYSAQRRMTHDFNAHWNALETMLADNRFQQALAYVKEVQSRQTERILLVNSKNAVIDALLNQKASVALKKGIDIRFEVNNLQGLKIHPADATVVLSNLLDNAIEACAKLGDNRQIAVRLLLADTFLLSVRNTALPVEIVNNCIETTKSPPWLHGFGLENTKSILNKYHAYYVMDYSDGWFQFTAEMDNSPCS